MKFSANMTNRDGVLHIADVSVEDLRAQFGTPLYVYDEDLLRKTARDMATGFKNNGIQTKVLYASKAASFVALLKIMKEEGLGLDVVSEGELYTAHLAGYPMRDVVYHGNNKLDRELNMALDLDVGTIVLDNLSEAHRLSDICNKRNQEIDVILRINPGIDAHTHAYIQTAMSDSKFGAPLAGGVAEETLLTIRDLPGLRLRGVHCHIGSQIFSTDSLFKAATTVIEAMADWRTKGLALDLLDLGGGFGVYYTEGDEPFDIPTFLGALSDYVAAKTAEHGIALSALWVEPGRSLVNGSGITLYEVGDVKRLQDDVNYVFIDGGMGDNMRPALYDAQYEAAIVNRLNDPAEGLWRVAGKYCESGDVLIRDLPLPVPQTGDLLAISGTGAYTFSMFSEYNRLTRPAVVFVSRNGAREVVRRQSLEHLVSLDVLED